MDLSRKIKVGKKEIQLLDVLMVSGLLAAGLLVRICLAGYRSGDWEFFLEPWTNQLKQHGFRALAVGFYNYTPIYMYILWFLTLLPVDTLLGIKAVSVVFDLILAVTVAKIVTEIKPGANPLLPFGIVWLTPTVVSNSSMWGQCDAIYTAFVMLCLLYLLREKSVKATVFFGIAFSIKLQSIFFAPILVLLFFLKKIRFWEFLIIPAVYLISIIPAWIAGRPIQELLLIYLGQSAGDNPTLSVIYPNIYYLIGNDVYLELYGKTAVSFTMGVLLVLLYYVLKKGYQIGLSKEVLITAALACGTVVVFLLPSMRERYSYMVDMLAVIYGFMNLKKLYVPLVRITLSYIAYTTYYRYGMYASYEVLACIQIFLVVEITYSLINRIKEEECRWISKSHEAQREGQVL